MKIASRALNAVALADLAQGRYGDAETALRRAIVLEPMERMNYRPLVRLLLGQGRSAEAAEVLRDQLWIQPHDRSIHQLLDDLERRGLR